MHVRQINRLFIRGVVLLGLFLLVACGDNNDGGDPLVAPGDGQQPGDQQPGGQQSVPLIPTNDAFTWTGNTSLRVVASNGLLANDPPGTTIIAADTVTTQGGTVNVDIAVGAFTYDPPVGLQNVDDTFTYTVTDAPAVTVTITLNERVWYVRNNAAGAGRGNDQAPFLTLAQAERDSDENDTIFVFAGDLTSTGQDRGIVLKNGQKLLGEGVGLSLNGAPLVDPVPEAVISNIALVGAAGETPVILLSTGNEVAGFAMEVAFNEGILALGGTGHNLHDNIITFSDTGREGIRLLNVTGSNAVIANTIDGSPRDGIKLANNENQAGDIVPAIPIVAAVTMSRNVIRNSTRGGISVNLAGAGTAVELQILTNIIDNSGTDPANLDEGIDIGSLGGASVTAVISRNIVSNSAGEAIDLAADNTSSMAAFVANSDLFLSGEVSDFRAVTANASPASMCLELINNVNTNVPSGNSTFQVENNSGLDGAFQFFEDLNDTLATRNPPDLITVVPQGTCGITLPGAALFTANCAICHTGNGLGFGSVGPDITNADVATNTVQLANPSMSDIRLTPQEIQAISNALAAAP